MPERNDNQVRDALVIVRTVGERTTDACMRIVREQVPARNLRTLSVRPFPKSVVQGFRTAARERPEWLFTLDADTLLVHDGIARLRELCDRAEPEVFHVKGLVLCRVYGGAQPRGFHAFRGSMLDEAVAHLDAVDSTTRPETSVVRRMEAAGHPSRFYAEILGIHDYEQRHADLFLKLRSRSKRAGDLHRLRARLNALTELHDDFRVSQWGLEDGIAFPDSTDAEALDRFDELCAEAGLIEIDDVTIEEPAAMAARTIDAYRPSALDYTHADFAFSGDPRRWDLTPVAVADPKSPSRVSPWASAGTKRSAVA